MPEPWPQLFAVWGFFALNVLSPGPNVFNTIGIALGSGRAAALGAAAGVAPGVLMWGAAATLGIAGLFALHPGTQTALTVVGGALLLLFAWRYLRRAATPPAALAARRGATPRQAFLATLAVLATNPKALTTWLVVLALFPVAASPAWALVVLVAGMATVATAIHVGYALAFSTRAAAAVYARASRAIDAGVGALFAVAGARLLAGAAGLV